MSFEQKPQKGKSWDLENKRKIFGLENQGKAVAYHSFC
jgi:hypothetical protein